MTLRDTGFDALERTVNRLLALDPEARGRLAALEGKLVEIDVRAPAIRFYVEPGADGLRLRPVAGREPDTVISGPALALVRTGLRRDPRGPALAEGVRISGDAQAGAALQAILQELDIDWEEQLSRVVGDIAAHQIGNVARGLDRWLRAGAESLRQDLGDWLREESRLLADHQDTERFLHGVDVLRADVDRLEQRIERLRRAVRERAQVPPGTEE